MLKTAARAARITEIQYDLVLVIGFLLLHTFLHALQYRMGNEKVAFLGPISSFSHQVRDPSYSTRMA